MIKRRLNLKPSVIDPNARQYHHFALGSVSLPSIADTTHYNPPIVDQGDQGSCTAHASYRAQGILQNMALAKKLTVPGLTFDAKFESISRDGFYYDERLHDGDTDQDGGSSLSTATWVAENIGFYRESLWPYSDYKMYNKPSAACYAEGAKHKILKAYQVIDGYHAKHALAMGYPVIFGVMVYDSFMDEQTAASGIIPMPNVDTEQLQGGHALCLVGYDDHKKMFKFGNSWGTSWGQNGYAWIPYDYIKDSSLTSDMWVFLVQP